MRVLVGEADKNVIKKLSDGQSMDSKLEGFCCSYDMTEVMTDAW